jgi:hypothetical protein
VPLASPPEKMTMRLPLKQLCTTWRMRSVSVAIGIWYFSKTFCASACSTWAVGGLTLMTWAPSWAAMCAA